MVRYKARGGAVSGQIRREQNWTCVARPQGERQGWRESNLDRRRRARIADIMDGIRNTARVATPYRGTGTSE